jgi:hypothetical protein
MSAPIIGQKRGCLKSKITNIVTEEYSLFREALKIVEDAMREGPAKKRGA